MRDWIGKRKRLAALFVGALALFGALKAYEAWAGGSLITFHSGLVWVQMRDDAPWLSRDVRLGLADAPPAGEPGEMTWRTLADGLDVAELPVLVDGAEVERVMLTRIDPAHFRFVVRNEREGYNDLDAWMRELGAVAVINGSYFSPEFGPATPVVIDGELQGPREYEARHGVFVSSDEATEVRDLAGADWRAAMADAEQAMLSYPLLIAADGSSRVPEEKRWLASRSFVAQDAQGRILLGTTPGGFFTLSRLADFLKRAPLDIVLALNLDGGPVACQGVAFGDYRRMTYGLVEIQADANGRMRALPAHRAVHAPLPIVLAVLPRA